MTAIEFNHVSKQYRLGLVSTKTLSHDIRRWWITSIMGKEDPYLKIGETNDRATKGTSEYVWALRDIDFKVEQGDVVGIIGKNGAGKSTLLKLLSRVTGPTTGTIRAHGRIGSLLEVGTGFHGEMTGRENIFMNGAILGMTRNEIQAKLDEIIDFSGCERYIDTPVKRYSSGMTVRLGFAVAAFLDPEILVVDEVLAVGDAEFQKKAIGKMKDVSQGEGRTVLFVSHNMASIRSLCSRGVLLEKGMVKLDGKVDDVVSYYLQSNAVDVDNNNLYFEDINTALGNDNIRIRSFSISPTMGPDLNIESGITLKLCFFNMVENALIDMACAIFTMEEVLVLQQSVIVSPNSDSKRGYYTVEMKIPSYLLNKGRYMMRIWFGKAREYQLWGFLNHTFSVEDVADDLGYIIDKPGLVWPMVEKSYSFSTMPE